MARLVRWRRSGRWIALVAVIVLLIGVQGWESEPPEPVDVPPVQQAAASADRSIVLPPTQVQTASRHEPVETPIPEAQPIAVTDRFLTCLRSAERACEAAEFELAFAALEQAGSLPLEAEQHRLLVVARSRVEAGLAARLETARRSVAEGRVLAAAGQLRLLLAPSTGSVARALDRFGADRGWPSLRSSIAAGELPAMPADLAPRCRVRVWHGGVWVTAAVARCRGAEVTVQLIAQGLFPAVERVAVEPVDSSVGVAIDQAVVALHAGDACLAALWLGRARAMGEVPARWSEVARALR